MNRAANAWIGAAAAEVAHRRINVGVAGVGVSVEQCDGGHDLAGLAVAALGDLVFDPGGLDGVQAVGRADAFNGGDRFVNGADRQHTGAHGLVTDMYRASAALGDAAAEFGSGQTQFVAQYPEQRHFGFDIYMINMVVDGQLHGVRVGLHRHRQA